jgi:alpha-ketoglutarate-dependent taurine dioxygenase
MKIDSKIILTVLTGNNEPLKIAVIPYHPEGEASQWIQILKEGYPVPLMDLSVDQVEALLKAIKIVFQDLDTISGISESKDD